MIIFTIGNEKFVLPSLQAAEQMLDILEKSTPVTSAYDADYDTYYYYGPTKGQSCGCEITHAALLVASHTIIRLPIKQMGCDSYHALMACMGV